MRGYYYNNTNRITFTLEHSGNEYNKSRYNDQEREYTPPILVNLNFFYEYLYCT